MELNQVDIHYLIAAICVISSALIFYTIGVWGERLQRKLKFWHLIFFLLGLLADTVGTSLMEHIAELTHLHDEMHYFSRFDAACFLNPNDNFSRCAFSRCMEYGRLDFFFPSLQNCSKE